MTETSINNKNRNKYIERILILLLLALLIPNIFSATPTETYTITNDMSFDGHPELSLSDWNIPIFTHNGAIYFTYIDPNLQTMIAKKDRNGKITKTVINSETSLNKYHTNPSIGIDKNGYIHVTYDMHNAGYSPGKPYDFTPWKYKVSDRPEDISSFTFHGKSSQKPNYHYITYPIFINDRDGELYLSHRHRAEDSGFDAGDYAATIQKYNVDTKRWSVLGGTDYLHGRKTLFWHGGPGRSNPHAYQAFNPRFMFDKNNRMHVVEDYFKNSPSPTQITYAYSDDGGQTFKKANGQAQTLPITPLNGDIVKTSPSGNLGYATQVGIGHDGRPVVGYRDGSTYKISTWDGSRWIERTPTGIGDLSWRMATDLNGVITVFGTQGIARSFDSGVTWKSYPIRVGNIYTATVDMKYLKETGHIRYHEFKGGKSGVVTLRFSGTQTPPAGSYWDGSNEGGNSEDNNENTDSSNSENLISAETYIKDSGNTHELNQIHKLWDGCLNVGECVIASSDSFMWVQFDLKDTYDLSKARLFADDTGSWRTNSWSLKYRNSPNENWRTAFSESSATSSQWYERGLNGIQARHILLEIYGTSGSEAREFELYGERVSSEESSGLGCHQVKTPSDLNDNRFAKPYDVDNNRLFITGTCGDDLLNINIDNPSNSEIIIYNKGFIWENNDWKEVPLEGEYYPGTSFWLENDASTTISNLDTTETNFFLTYICKKTNSDWKCGCRDQSCNSNYWNLQIFRK